MTSLNEFQAAFWFAKRPTMEDLTSCLTTMKDMGECPPFPYKIDVYVDRSNCAWCVHVHVEGFEVLGAED